MTKKKTFFLLKLTFVIRSKEK